MRSMHSLTMSQKRFGHGPTRYLPQDLRVGARTDAQAQIMHISRAPGQPIAPNELLTNRTAARRGLVYHSFFYYKEKKEACPRTANNIPSIMPLPRLPARATCASTLAIISRAPSTLVVVWRWGWGWTSCLSRMFNTLAIVSHHRQITCVYTL